MIFAVTAVSSIAVLAQQGIYTALLWAPFPIGAIGYVNARYFPLGTKPKSAVLSGTTDG